MRFNIHFVPRDNTPGTTPATISYSSDDEADCYRTFIQFSGKNPDEKHRYVMTDGTKILFAG